MIIFESSVAQESSGLSLKPDAIFGFYSKVLVETELKDARSAVYYWMKRVGRRVGLEIEEYFQELIEKRTFANESESHADHGDEYSKLQNHADFGFGCSGFP